MMKNIIMNSATLNPTSPNLSPQNSRTAPSESSFPQEINAVKKTVIPTERSLAAGYLLLCAQNGEHIEGEQLKTYLSAQETLEEVRRLVPDRGNVTTDIKRTNYSSARNAFIAEAIDERLKEQGEDSVLREAISAKLVGAMVCDTGASLASALHGKKLVAKQNMKRVTDLKVGHAFSLLDDKDHDIHLVLDPWAEGPVVLQKHSAFGHPNRHQELTERKTYDPKSGRQLSKDFHEFIHSNKETKPLETQIQTRRVELEKDKNFTWNNTWHPTPVFSQTFLDNTKASMNLPLTNQPIHNGILATKVARSMGSHNVRDITKNANRIAQASENLQNLYPQEKNRSFMAMALAADNDTFENLVKKMRIAFKSGELTGNPNNALALADEFLEIAVDKAQPNDVMRNLINLYLEPDPYSATVLSKAIEHGEETLVYNILEIAKVICQTGDAHKDSLFALLAAKDPKGTPGLVTAFQKNHLGVVNALLEQAIHARVAKLITHDQLMILFINKEVIVFLNNSAQEEGKLMKVFQENVTAAGKARVMTALDFLNECEKYEPTDASLKQSSTTV